MKGWVGHVGWPTADDVIWWVACAWQLHNHATSKTRFDVFLVTFYLLAFYPQKAHLPLRASASLEPLYCQELVCIDESEQVSLATWGDYHWGPLYSRACRSTTCSHAKIEIQAFSTLKNYVYTEKFFVFFKNAGKKEKIEGLAYRPLTTCSSMQSLKFRPFLDPKKSRFPKKTVTTPPLQLARFSSDVLKNYLQAT